MTQATAPATVTTAQMPSSSLLANLRQELARYTPFSLMAVADLDFFLSHAEQLYFAPGEILFEPASGEVNRLFFIRRGAVSGKRGLADLEGGAFEYETGDLFPISAAIARRAVTATYEATQDTFVLALTVEAMQTLAQQSVPFADFLNRRVLKFLDLSRQALQVAYSSQTLAEQSLETALGELVQRAPVTCRPETPLREALTEMHERRIGSMLVTSERGEPLGILSREDVLGRVTLGAVPLETPIGEVMVSPVHHLSHEHTAEDAALLMSRHTIRHVPITRDGMVIGIVSERDLFAMQRLSLKHVSTSIRAAVDVDMLRLVAQDIRRFARSLLSQGVQARQLTALISHLNDVLTERLLEIKATEHGVDLSRLCWLALGSEGRNEQTIATDQDNALILPDDISAAARQTALVFARDVNQALDDCGYPLCKGGIMAGNPACCLTLREWRERFSHWIEHGAPQDLLNASIYFDFRPLAGDLTLAHRLRQEVNRAASRVPRFLKQLALNALTREPPLNWMGGIAADDEGRIDLKLQGTAIFVDGARLYALSQGVAATSTRERLEAVGPVLGVTAAEYEAWVRGFEFLQMLRLQIQLEGAAAGEQPNHIVVDSLNDIDRRILKETFRVARSLQQRLQLDYER
ncbi:MAG: CBS domain-containing protein [Burkholderiaceae bacterium]|nr:CBS domain-containing protein [Burkholderiaceae bacterium]